MSFRCTAQWLDDCVLHKVSPGVSPTQPAPFIGCVAAEYFLLFRGLSFHFVDGFLCCAKTFQFDVVLFVYFFLSFPLPGEIYQEKNITKSNILVKEILLPMFSSRSFIVLSLTFKSLIHFQFIFFLWCKKVVQFHFFCTYLSTFPRAIF